MYSAMEAFGKIQQIKYLGSHLLLYKTFPCDSKAMKKT